MEARRPMDVNPPPASKGERNGKSGNMAPKGDEEGITEPLGLNRSRKPTPSHQE